MSFHIFRNPFIYENRNFSLTSFQAQTIHLMLRDAKVEKIITTNPSCCHFISNQLLTFVDIQLCILQSLAYSYGLIVSGNVLPVVLVPHFLRDLEMCCKKTYDTNPRLPMKIQGSYPTDYYMVSKKIIIKYDFPFVNFCTENEILTLLIPLG